MTKTNQLASIVFAIDKPQDVHTQAKFLRYVDTLRAMGKLVGSVTQCIGSYQGVLERSYMMLMVDFDKHVRNSGFVSDQESFLHVPGDTRQPCVLEYQSSGVRVGLSPMASVNKEKALAGTSWTYSEQRGIFYVCEA